MGPFKHNVIRALCEKPDVIVALLENHTLSFPIRIEFKHVVSLDADVFSVDSDDHFSVLVNFSEFVATVLPEVGQGDFVWGAGVIDDLAPFVFYYNHVTNRQEFEVQLGVLCVEVVQEPGVSEADALDFRELLVHARILYVTVGLAVHDALLEDHLVAC